MIDRRHDNETATHVRVALEMQRATGFDCAFSMLKKLGIDEDLARTVLHPHQDRRSGRLGSSSDRVAQAS